MDRRDAVREASVTSVSSLRKRSGTMSTITKGVITKRPALSTIRFLVARITDLDGY